MRAAAVAVLLACLLTGSAWAQQAGGERPDLWALPDDPVAYWALDAGFLEDAAGSDPNRALAEAVLILLLRTVREGDAPSPGLEAVLRPSVLAESAYRLALLDLAAEGEAGGGARARGVLQVFTSKRQETIEAALRNALSGADSEVRFEREEFPGGGSITRGGSLAWRSEPEVFTVFFGDLPADRPLSENGRGAPGWKAYRDRCEVLHPEGRPVFEAFVDLDRLRRQIPDEVGWGPMGDLMRAWHISNARGLMLRARLTTPPEGGPGTIHGAVAWASRAEPPVQVRAAAITHAHWPQGLGSVPADAGYFTAIALPPQLALSLAVGSYEALARHDPTFGQRKLQWVRNLGPRLDRATRTMPPMIVIAGPGHTMSSPVLRIPATPSPEMREDLRAVFASLSPHVSWDERGRFWSVETDPLSRHRPFLLAPTAQGVAGGWNARQLLPPTPER